MKKINKPSVFIFLGRSGCGKGTQAQLLMDFISKNAGENVKTLHIESGALLRGFAPGDTFTQKKTKTAIESGVLAPEAIIVSLWMKYITDNFTGSENIVFDGCPRKLNEAKLLTDTLQFIDIKKPLVVCVNVSRKWSEERLFSRARKDDTKESINKRLDWFETEVVPVINYYKGSSYYNVVDVNGEQPIEDVHKEILAKLGLNR